MSNADGTAKRAGKATAVSSGESSDAVPRPAPALKPSVPPDPDVTFADVNASPVGSLLPSPISDKSNDLTLTEASRQPGSGSSGESRPNPIFAAIGATILNVGTVLGGRYRIEKLLGMGGMGAVYKAHDLEVDRTVGLKVIRPDLASNPAILARFKQELVLARQVTHRNIVRIYDLNEADGVKFITMEFIEGEDLRTILTQEGKLPPQEAVKIMLQACSGLQAAHTEGVIHRDLKPSNIMRDVSGRVVIMDFGLAKTVQGDGMTQTGMMLGTIEYMSPEQALGSELDVRSDLFTMGLIFYELLTGNIPYRAESAIASLLKRTREPAAPISEVEPEVPSTLSLIAAKCLERDVTLRYQTTLDLLADLENWQGRPDRAIPGLLPKPSPPARIGRRPTIIAVVAALAISVLLSGYVWRDKLLPSRVAHTSLGPSVSLAILPFRNASGDPSLDWVGSYLAETLATDVGQSGALRTVSSDRVGQLLHDLQVTPNSSLDASMVRRVATSSDAQVVVWGQYVKFGDEIRIDASLQDLKRGRAIPLKFEAPNQNALPATIDRFAQAIRENLSLSASLVKELQAQAFQPSSKSLPALRDYNQGVELMRRWEYLEAQKRLQAATNEDPEFALAYARWAQANSVLGYDNEAEAASRKAVELSQNLPFPEKFRIEAIHAWTMRDYSKAIEDYESLAKVSPDDGELGSALGQLYLSTGAYDKARNDYSRLLDRDPKSAEALFGMGRVELQTGNPQKALDYLNRALSQSIEFENDEEQALILHVIGMAYRMLDKPDQALHNFQQSLLINRRLGEKAAIARSLNQIGQVMDGLGKPDDALNNYQEALKLRREIEDRRGIGDTLIDLGNLYTERGQYGQAMPMYKESLEIEREVGNEPAQALALNNLGNVYFAEGDYQAALTFYQQALQLRERLRVAGDIAETVHNLGDTAVRMGQLDQGLTDYLRALDLYRSAGDKRDAAIESHSTAEVFKYQGRYGAALKAEDEALKVFRQLQDHGSWLADILGGYGDALTLLGRGDEAQASLEEAGKLAQEIKSDPLLAQVANFEGDRLFYGGDLKSARAHYEDALHTASRTTDHDKLLLSKLNLAKVAVAEGSSREAIKTLKELASQADTLGLKYFSLECSLYLAQAQIDSKDYSSAKQQLRAALDKSDKLGARVLLAKSHFLMANALRLTGDSSEAGGHYREAVRLLNAIRSEPGAEKVLDRADLKPIYQESTRWAQAPTR